MDGLIDLLSNSAIVLFPYWVFQWYKNLPQISHKKNELLIGMVSSITIILCMSFPFQILPGYIFDLRTIPFLIGIFYGGYIGGGISALTLYLFRLYLGGDGMWNVWIVYSIIMVFSFLIIPIYQEASIKRKKWISTGLALLTATLMLVNTNFREGLPTNEWLSMLLYLFLHGLITWITVDTFEENTCTYRSISWDYGWMESKKRNQIKQHFW